MSEMSEFPQISARSQITADMLGRAQLKLQFVNAKPFRLFEEFLWDVMGGSVREHKRSRLREASLIRGFQEMRKLFVPSGDEGSSCFCLNSQTDSSRILAFLAGEERCSSSGFCHVRVNKSHRRQCFLHIIAGWLCDKRS